MTSLLRIFAIGAALLAAGPAFAQGYPEQGIKIVVGFPPGVAPDINVRKRMAELGVDLIGNTPAEFAAAIKAEIPQWAAVIKGAGIKARE